MIVAVPLFPSLVAAIVADPHQHAAVLGVRMPDHLVEPPDRPARHALRDQPLRERIDQGAGVAAGGDAGIQFGEYRVRLLFHCGLPPPGSGQYRRGGGV